MIRVLSSILIINMMSISNCADIFTPNLNGAKNYENFWFNITNYPHKEITELINKLRNTEYQQIESRLAVDHFENVCIDSKEIFLPLAAVNPNNQTMFIVNVESVRQEIEVIKCSENCGEIALHSSMSTRCDKEYIQIPLIAVTENGELITEYFNYHSNCYCACE